jgi:hypothetical protein
MITSQSASKKLPFWWKNTLLTSSDLFLTFDPEVMSNFFALLVKPHHMQQTRLKSEHVLNFDPVLKIIDL